LLEAPPRDWTYAYANWHKIPFLNGKSTPPSGHVETTYYLVFKQFQTLRTVFDNANIKQSMHNRNSLFSHIGIKVTLRYSSRTFHVK